MFAYISNKGSTIKVSMQESGLVVEPQTGIDIAAVRKYAEDMQPYMSYVSAAADSVMQQLPGSILMTIVDQPPPIDAII